MTSRFIDKYDRVDGDIGDNYLIPCGGVEIFDEAVLPVDIDRVASPVSFDDLTDQKTQVLYNEEAMDGPDQMIRAVWAHDPVTLTGTTDPSFTILGRMTKDPLLVDLGVPEQPFCYDQGYGLRVTCPRAGDPPILKIVKFTTRRLPPGITPPASAEVDAAIVLTSVTLQSQNLNLDPDQTDALPLLYRGFWQDMRLRIRRADNEVVLEAYLNDRNMNNTILAYTDRQDPLWGAAGFPGYEFLSATSAEQPTGASPFGLAGEAVMRCGLFQAETIKDFRRPVITTPGNFYTYRQVTNRVITLVEKNGDARYTATGAGATKLDTYLQFVLEAEADIIREEGYYHWLYRTSNIFLRDEESTYELPEDTGLIEIVRPGNWQNIPLQEMEQHLFYTKIAGILNTTGRPTIYTLDEESVNNRKRIIVFPVPNVEAINTIGADAEQDPFMVVSYYARRLRPNEPDVQIPYVPQEHIDVLIYGATYHALLLDTDPNNAQAFGQRYQRKLSSIRRENNRKAASRRSVMRSVADIFQPNITSRIPLLRATQLETLLI
jgi:hypothetical protein